MKTKITSYTLDSLPSITEAQRQHLIELAAQPDFKIDTTDSPEMSEEQWVSARRRIRRSEPAVLMSFASASIRTHNE